LLEAKLNVAALVARRLLEEIPVVLLSVEGYFSSTVAIKHTEETLLLGKIERGNVSIFLFTN
jgi:hypothetical protein